VTDFLTAVTAMRSDETRSDHDRPRSVVTKAKRRPVRGSLDELHISTVGSQIQQGQTPFIFLHGLGGTQVYWTAADSDRYLPPQSTLVDLLGFGQSPRPFKKYTLDTHLAALEAALAGQPPAILVGHSLGAALALAYAVRNPESVKGLVLISLPSYGGTQGAIRWHRRRLSGWFLTNMVLTGLACVTTRRLLGPLLPLILRDIPREVARDLVEHNVMSSTTSLWNVLYRRDAVDDLDALAPDLPVTFIHGTKDDTAPIDSIRAVTDGYENRKLIELEGVDHHPWLRAPGACATAIVDAGHAIQTAPPKT